MKALRSTYDPRVVAEYQRRLKECRTNTAWMRYPAYAGFLLISLGFLLFGQAFFPFGVALAFANALFLALCLSPYAAGTATCPNCRQIPFNHYSRQPGDNYCRECGYWLVWMDVDKGHEKQLRHEGAPERIEDKRN